MDTLRTNGWRLALVAGGVTALIGGPQHPDSDAALPLREELAVMTADDAWVPSHALLLASVVLVAVGLLAARRADRWPERARSALRLAGVAMALYAVEATLHLAAVVDSDRLANGEFAPVAFAHIGLALVLYPVSGLAVANLAWRLLPTWSLPQRPVAVLGIVGGILHTLALPATLIFDQTELSAMFAFAALFQAVWAVGVGLVGIRSWRPAAEPALAAAPV